MGALNKFQPIAIALHIYKSEEFIDKYRDPHEN